MSAFVMAEILEVSDPAGMKQYAEAARPTIEQYGGRYRTLRGKMEVMEGDWRPAPLVIIEFPSLERAHAWYGSPEYRPLIVQRQAVSRTNFVFIEGL
ncbi:DUF1330 domain-containing protein [Polycyclovorans algicola]|jgi:uncharacterized protein (DUF1330 family)|uniref:DUF1330 domain-containing protein n=1 Tax=Polycyclovorans algicola TaxID=616992 RepID=UPI0004A718FA|nr:DUF1330 domain-containing protein [Polycyclovorans algicola]